MEAASVDTEHDPEDRGLEEALGEVRTWFEAAAPSADPAADPVGFKEMSPGEIRWWLASGDANLGNRYLRAKAEAMLTSKLEDRAYRLKWAGVVAAVFTSAAAVAIVQGIFGLL